MKWQTLCQGLMLKEDITAIIARGQAMQARGEKFFEVWLACASK